MKAKLALPLKYKFYLSVLLVVISLLIPASGYLLYKQQADVLRQDKYQELKTIADRKENQITNWLHERNADAEIVTESPFFIDGINRWLQDTSNLRLKAGIFKQLNPVQKELGYKNIILARTNGDLLLSATDNIAEINALLKQKITEASDKREIVFTDFYLGQKENEIFYDIVSPLFSDKSQVIAVLIFRSDPTDFLFPLIKTWPAPGMNTETATLRVENDSVIFLNELHHHKNTTLNLKIPLTRTEVLSVQAALGNTGLFEGIDYRGVQVLADIRTIEGTNWIMLTKVDRREIYAGLYLLAGIISGFTILLIIVCGIGFAYIYNVRQKTIYRELYGKEKELWGQEEKFRVTMDSLGEGTITLDINGKVQYLNKLAEEMTGWNLREARGRELHDIYPVKNEETGESENNILNKIYNQGIVKDLANHTILTSKNGREIPVMDTGAPIYDNDGTVIGVVIAFQDETEKRRQRKLLAESEARYRNLVDNASVGVYETTLDGKVLYGNKALIDMFGFQSPEELKASPMLINYKNPKRREDLLSELKQCGKVENFEIEIGSKDGSELFILMNSKVNGNVLNGMVVNITDIKLAEQKILDNAKHIESLNRLLTMMSSVNQLIARENCDENIVAESCRIAVEDGKFKLAWIAVPEANKSISVKAKYGRIDSYLDQLSLTLDAEGNDKEITVSALTNKKHFISNDMENDLALQPYKDNALRSGFKSCASFPIFVSGSIYGAISLYSDVKDYFQPEEVKLLDETALDIGLAFETNELGRKKSLAEKQLEESNERFIRLVSELNEVVWTASIDGSEILDINDSFKSIYGISTEESKNHSNLLLDPVHPEDRAIAEASFKELLEKGKSKAEYRIVRPDGKTVWLDDHKSLIYDETGIAVQMGGIAKNITERKLNEEKIRSRTEDLGLINSLNYAINRGDKLDVIIALLSKEIMRIFNCFGMITTFPNPDKSFLLPTNIQLPAPLLVKLEKLVAASLHDHPLKIALKGKGKIAGVMHQGFPRAFNDANEIIEVMAEFTENNTLKRLAPTVFKLFHFRSIVLIPLVSENEIYGMLEIARAVETSSEELNRLKVLAGQLTQIIGRKLAEEKVIDEKNNATQYFEAAGIMLVILNKDGKIIRINKKGCEVLQYAKSEITGKDWFEFLPENSAQELRPFYKKLMKEEVAGFEFYENPIVTQKGEERLIKWHNAILRDTDGTPVGVLSSGEDITVEKQNEKFLVTQRNFGITTSAITDLNELYRVSTESFFNLTGMECVMIYLFDEEKKNLERVYSEGLTDQFVSLTSQYNEHSDPIKFGKPDQPTFVNYQEHPDESSEIERAEKLVSVANLPIINKGKIIGYIHLASHQSISMPVSLQKSTEVIVTLISNAIVRINTEDNIRNLNASLELKVEQRTAQLDLAKTEAESANVAKSDFLSRMSHELRTPLNSILGFTQLLNRGETTPEGKKRISHIMNSGKHLLDLINEVLDLARIESGKLSLSLEPVQLREIITETLDIVYPIAEKSAVKLQLAESTANNLFVKSDRQKLKQVLINLINNAVKYNRPGGTVEVAITRTGDHIRMSVHDTGIGIAAEELPKLFEPFQRIGAVISEVEGTGLGLAVAKKLVDAMNGSIGVESELGVGSTFWVELLETESPSESKGKKPKRSKSETPGSARRGTILYIEDNTSNIQLVEEILKTERPNVRLLTEMQGKNAVKTATEYQPGLILLDLDLPDMHGSKVLHLLQSDPATKSIPVVILSADATTHTIEQLLAAGAQHYLTKPLDVNLFLEVTDELLNTGGPKND